MQEIEITIDEEGLTEIDLKGFAGKGCSQLTDKLVKGLSGEVNTRQTKKEYYKPVPKVKVKQQQQ